MSTATLLHPSVTAPAATPAVDVARLVSQAVAELADLAHRHRIVVSCQHIGSSTVETDAAALRAVVRELLADAITASEWEEYVLVRTVGRLTSVHIDIVTFGAIRFRTGRILEAFLPRRPGVPVTSAAALRWQLERLGCRLRTSTDVGRTITFTVMVPRRRLTGGQPIE